MPTLTPLPRAIDPGYFELDPARGLVCIGYRWLRATNFETKPESRYFEVRGQRFSYGIGVFTKTSGVVIEVTPYDEDVLGSETILQTQQDLEQAMARLLDDFPGW